MRATSKQIEFVEILRSRLKLSSDWLNSYSTATYGSPPEDMDARVCSALIDELLDWAEHPDKLLRAMGQTTLFEVAP